MEKQTRNTMRTLKSVGLAAMLGVVSGCDQMYTPNFKGEVDGAKMTLTTGIMDYSPVTKLVKMKDKLEVATTNNENYVFYSHHGNLKAVEYSQSNKWSKTYGTYSSKFDSFKPVFSNYQSKVEQALSKQPNKPMSSNEHDLFGGLFLLGSGILVAIGAEMWRRYQDR